MPIHPTAIVDRSAEIDSSAAIGAYATIEAGVKILADVVVHPHAFVGVGTTLAARVHVHPFAVVGHEPQDRAWKRTPSYTFIDEDAIIREHVSVHRGTTPESTTRIGKRAFLMACSHVAHNGDVGDDVVLANGVLLAGHVTVGARTFMGGSTAAHQFCRIGELCMIAGLTRIRNDVPPFMTAAPAGVVAPNAVGLRRAGFSAAERSEIRAAYHLLYRRGLPFREAIERLDRAYPQGPVRRLVEFLRAPSKRGYFAGPRKRAAGAAPPGDEDPGE